MPKFLDLTGSKFGRLSVVKLDSPKGRRICWLCLCECGNQVAVRSNSLRVGETQSCGCKQRDEVAKRSKTHGHTRGSNGKYPTSEYYAWFSAKSRCCNPKNKGYKHYGARGITICRQWRESFEVFLHDMGPRPPGYSLDRKNNSGNYEPGNCRWSTRKQQNQNTRRNVLAIIGGETHCVTEWVNRLGINRGAVSSRLQRGWTPERALCEPVHRYRKKATI